MRGLDLVVKGIQFLFLVAGLGMLGLGLFQTGHTYFRVTEAQGWPTTPGTILSRDWDTERFVGRSNSGVRYVPKIRYRYTVDGQMRIGENIFPATAEEWPTQTELQAFLDTEFPARGTVPVSYDPANPARAALILRGSYGDSITLVICGLIPLAMLLAVRAMLADGGGRSPNRSPQ